MEMLDGSRRLIREWETSSMEEDGCCCRGATELHQQNTLIQIIRQKETRLRRTGRFLAVAFILLISVALALLIMVVQGRLGHQSPDSQPTMQPISPSSGIRIEQQQRNDLQNPRAMLTAPKGKNTVGKYLEWESKDGHAFCHGGFNYSSGDLVVPINGIYRVFLQITYESKKVQQCVRDELRLSNMVFLFRETYTDDVCLLSSVDTVSCSMEPWSKSLYTAGLFFLEANGKLRVTSSHSELIVKKEYQVFFGAEFLPQ
ncbi:lymphotoxin-alpha-like [Chaetodon auriga]|uniref:lymphotoxin-alpha-like n=1 Tax=Chaetodon auriga TaxID=39042 RepID=UPI004032AA7E